MCTCPFIDHDILFWRCLVPLSYFVYLPVRRSWKCKWGKLFKLKRQSGFICYPLFNYVSLKKMLMKTNALIMLAHVCIFHLLSLVMMPGNILIYACSLYRISSILPSIDLPTRVGSLCLNVHTSERFYGPVSYLNSSS